MTRAEMLIVLNRSWQELRGNRRLQWGLAAAAIILVVEGGMRWNDHLVAQGRAVRNLESELVTLRSQVRSEPALRKTLANLAEARAAVEGRLWSVPSEAIGQARLKEWLDESLRKSGATGANLNISSVRTPGGEGSSQTDSNAGGLREFRANVRFSFVPSALEYMLAEVEAGEIVAGVESLAVNRRERRVEMTLRVLMRVAGQHQAGGA